MELVEALLKDPQWREPQRFALLRETVRLMPLQGDVSSAADVRQQALVLAEKDKAFNPLRAKIHSQPDPADAKAVREYAGAKGQAELSGDYEKLASSIDALYASAGAEPALEQLAKKGGSSADLASGGVAKLRAAGDPAERVSAAAQLLAQMREEFPAAKGARALLLLQASLALEDDLFVSAAKARDSIASGSRRAQLGLLQDGAAALYGVGFLSSKQLSEVRASVTRIAEASPTTVNVYRNELVFLGRVPEWANGWLEFNFSRMVAHLRPLEPQAILFTQDRMRGSPLLLFSDVLDDLTSDANSLAGIEHELFAKKAGSGLARAQSRIGARSSAHRRDGRRRHA